MKKIIIIVVSLISLILIVCIPLFIKSDNNNTNKSTTNNNESNNTGKNTNKTDPKLEELNNIHEKIKFFKMSKVDDYIAYKKEHPNLSDELIVIYVNIGLNRKFYTEPKPSSNPSSLTVLTNKYNYLDASYVPSDLETINAKYSNGAKELRHDAKIAFEQLAKEAKEEGYIIRATSAYRSYSYQKSLYNNYVKNDGVANADTYSARAGHSEHQTGLAVDVDNGHKEFSGFGSTKEFTWMKQNAHKYGYILRYTTETEWITGYINEPWHYRYVGVEIATYIHQNPMTYEEYYVRFLDKNN